MSSRVNIEVSGLNIKSAYYEENAINWSIYSLVLDGVKFLGGYSNVNFTAADITKFNNLMQKMEVTILNDDGTVEKYVLSDYITFLRTMGIKKQIIGGFAYRQDIDKDVYISYEEFAGLFGVSIVYRTGSKYMFEINIPKKS